jgi:hypothetical protein
VLQIINFHVQLKPQGGNEALLHGTQQFDEMQGLTIKSSGFLAYNPRARFDSRSSR